MNHIVIVSSLSLFQEEVEELVRCVNNYSYLNSDTTLELILIDNLEVSQRYSKSFYYLLDSCFAAVQIKKNSHVSKLEAIVNVTSEVTDGVILVIDPDMHANLFDLPKFLNEINKGKVVVYGNRVSRTDVGFYRSLSSRLFNKLLKTIFNINIKDVNTPMVMLTPEVNKYLQFAINHSLLLKVYLPYSVGERFKEVDISVVTSPKKSSYTWWLLIKQAVKQFYQAYITMKLLLREGKR